jgi:segregation and condensation protein B
MDHKALVEAALFVSERPLSMASLAEITGLKEAEIPELVFQLQKDMLEDDRGVELVQTPEGYEMRLKPEYRSKVSKLAPFSDLSEGMLRTLAIVVANQPVKQSVIIRYQGNKAYGYIDSLERKGLVATQKSGRTKLVSTTPDFEKYFGMSTEEIKKKLGSPTQ